MADRRSGTLLLTALRWGAALVFLIFGAGKFVDHAAELSSFREYGLPLTGVAVVVIGVVEIAGGALLAANRLVRPAASVLALDMVGAIVVAGIGQGEILSLTLAPALLVAMAVLLTAGRRRHPGEASSGRDAAGS